MISSQREKAPKFYEILDSLMLSNYSDCKIVEGAYILENSEIQIDVRLHSYYFKLNPKTYIAPERFKSNGSWSNDMLKCGFKLTASTGKTYSYPGLTDYIGVDNEDDDLIRATYYFTCIKQMVLFFTDAKKDYGFKKVSLG